MMFVVDNGLEFHSPQFHSVAMHLNADLLFCAVRQPWLKPFVERTLGSYLRYLIRLLSLNGASLKEARPFYRSSRRAPLQASDVVFLAGLADVPIAWFEHRMPSPHVQDHWSEVALFGLNWRDDWLLRGQHQQVCPLCIRERGIARLEWDLIAYPACHIHSIVLQDICRICKRAISPERPALDVCNCGGYLAARENEVHKSSASVQAWTSWLSEQLLDRNSVPSQDGSLLQYVPQLEGASADGAYRLICAFAGGVKAFRKALFLAGAPWISSRQICSLLAEGLDTLHEAADARIPRALQTGTPYALAEQAVRGITAWDRAVAARAMLRLKLGRRWHKAASRCPTQQELFEDAS